MKILLAHNKYQQAGGEDSVYESELGLLLDNGMDVRSYLASNDEIQFGWKNPTKPFSVAVNTLWSRKVYKEFITILKSWKPDVVHFHNTFPTISPSAYYACKNSHIPVVQTLHNFRLFCASGTLVRQGDLCDSCLDGKFFRAARHRCYRNSLGASTILASMQHLHHFLGTYDKCVDRYIALTEFAREWFAKAGLPEQKLVVKPNFLNDDPGAGSGNHDYYLFAGRLSKEKGISYLIDAWRAAGDRKLIVLGDGPERQKLAHAITQFNLNIELAGHLPKDKVLELMGGARALLIPSQWYEMFPMTIVESLAVGTPVLASNLGNLPSIIFENITGYLFDHQSPSSLIDTLNKVETCNYNALRASCRREFLEKYSRAPAIENITKIYKSIS